MNKIDTFSANSLKILDKDVEEFKNKYINNLSFYKKDKKAYQGSKFHSLINFYIKNYDTAILHNDLTNEEKNYWIELKKILEPIKNDFIKTEYSFLIKDNFNNKDFYLTGRFDAILKDKDKYIIYDWKTLNIPKNASDDMQTIVYLYCANKIFNSKNIVMKYLSIEKLNCVEIPFENSEKYKDIITRIISKLY